MTDSPMTAPAAPSASAGEVLSGYLTTQAGAFLRALPQAVGEAGSRPGSLPASAAGADDLLRAVRRIGGALHTFGAAFESGWAGELRTELAWLLDLLGREPGYRRRSSRLLAALDSLGDGGAESPGMLAGHAGAPKARALLERQLTLARTRAHTALLQELRTARLHALADRMTLLSGEVPLLDEAAGRDGRALVQHAAGALAALAAAAERLPLARAVEPYGGDGLHRLAVLPAARSASPADADELLAADDEPWHRVRVLAKRARYALEVCAVPTAELDRLDAVLDRHRDASDAAATASTAARTPRITPATAYVLGVVHADQRLEVEAARYAFGHQWPKLPHHGWHEWATV
ncbi:CHAD domain-containing protein [Kitasatospora sp. DSM 101779]|uniref:CHAD domain-containing protein n=1 Tax=Kitasatospora sp. DSM 101779 TaxID=2853165 RepID=UPI0021D97B46|nr:CHAD domain-containing protein [Kitasatospora sp. DSM 101779]MCU7823428.1 CHAD domain-containing protein [Kitasatospora sp. DSM 101779]